MTKRCAPGGWAGGCLGSMSGGPRWCAGSQHVASWSHTQPSRKLLQKASFHCPKPSIITQFSPSPPLLGSPGRQLLEQKALG